MLAPCGASPLIVNPRGFPCHPTLQMSRTPSDVGGYAVLCSLDGVIAREAKHLSTRLSLTFSDEEYLSAFHRPGIQLRCDPFLPGCDDARRVKRWADCLNRVTMRIRDTHCVRWNRSADRAIRHHDHLSASACRLSPSRLRSRERLRTIRHFRPNQRDRDRRNIARDAAKLRECRRGRRHTGRNGSIFQGRAQGRHGSGRPERP
jgi:hypothetical protein